jgi:hypothetical protein
MGLAAVLCLALSTHAAGAATVSPDVYAHSICDEAAAFDVASKSLSDALQQAVQAFETQPTQASALALRQAMVDLLQASGESLDRMISASQSAGTPGVKGGAGFAKAVLAHLRTGEKSLRTLVAQAAAIRVGSASQFATDFQKVAAKVTSVSKQAVKSAKADPAFRHPAAALRALVVYLTTSATTCPSS